MVNNFVIGKHFRIYIYETRELEAGTLMLGSIVVRLQGRKIATWLWTKAGFLRPLIQYLCREKVSQEFLEEHIVEILTHEELHWVFFTLCDTPNEPRMVDYVDTPILRNLIKECNYTW